MASFKRFIDPQSVFVQTLQGGLRDLALYNPALLGHMADLWKALSFDSDGQAKALPPALKALSADVPWSLLLDLALDLKNPVMTALCSARLDFTRLGAEGEDLLAHPPAHSEDERYFPLRPQEERGWVAVRAFDESFSDQELLALMNQSDSPTVWCELLPSEGNQATWLELALASGRWDLADQLWKAGSWEGLKAGIPSHQTVLADQDRARLALAWLSGVGPHRSSSSVLSHHTKTQDVFLTWWDRLLPTTALMLETVASEKGWSNVAFGSASPLHLTEALGLATAALAQSERGESVDMASLLLPTLMFGGAHHAAGPVLRPLDLLLPTVATLSANSSLVPGVAQRLKAVDWSTVPPDASFRPPAHVLVGDVRVHAKHGTALDSVWPSLLRDMARPFQDSWWTKAATRSLLDGFPLVDVTPLFKNRFELSANQFVVQVLQRELKKMDDKNYGTPKDRLEEKAALLRRALEVTFPGVLASSTKAARAQWKAFVTPLEALAKQAIQSNNPQAEGWRALQLHLELPVVRPEATPPKPRF